MGEVADAMINGDKVCGGCGVYLEWADAPGFPLYCCRKCAADEESWFMSESYRIFRQQDKNTEHQ